MQWDNSTWILCIFLTCGAVAAAGWFILSRRHRSSHGTRVAQAISRARRHVKAQENCQLVLAFPGRDKKKRAEREELNRFWEEIFTIAHEKEDLGPQAIVPVGRADSQDWNTFCGKIQKNKLCVASVSTFGYTANGTLDPPTPCLEVIFQNQDTASTEFWCLHAHSPGEWNKKEHWHLIESINLRMASRNPPRDGEEFRKPTPHDFDKEPPAKRWFVTRKKNGRNGLVRPWPVDKGPNSSPELIECQPEYRKRWALHHALKMGSKALENKAAERRLEEADGVVTGALQRFAQSSQKRK